MMLFQLFSSDLLQITLVVSCLYALTANLSKVGILVSVLLRKENV